MRSTRADMLATALILVCSSLVSAILLCGRSNLLAGPPPAWLQVGLAGIGVVTSIGVTGVLHGHAEPRSAARGSPPAHKRPYFPTKEQIETPTRECRRS